MKTLIILLAMTMFIIGTDGFVIAGVLTEIATQTNVSIPVAGQLITLFALTYAISSPISASIFGNVERKKLIIFSLIIFSLGNFIVAICSNYSYILIGRFIAALGAGALTPTILMVAALIAPPESRGKYISYVVSGITIATIIGVPLGTFASKFIGFQGIFIIITILGIIMAIILANLLKSIPLPPKVGLMQRISTLSIKGVFSTLIVTLIVFVAAFTVYSYISAYYMNKINITNDQLSWVLLVFGIGGALGNFLGGYLTDLVGTKKTVLLSLLGLAFSFGLIALFGNSLPSIFIFTFLWGISGWLLAPSQQYRLMVLGKEKAQILVSLNSSCMYLGIALSGALGAILINLFDYTVLPWFGCIAAVIGVVIVLMTYKKIQHS